MKFILGKKIGMTQIWQEDVVVPVTKIQAGPCYVVQVKTKEKDGYNAVQVGFDTKKDKNIKKPQLGHLKFFSSKPRHLREFRVSEEELSGLKVGSKIDVSTFEPGDRVDVSGTSKGRGFQGVVKRHGFAGAIKTHGTKDQVRMPGSSGAMGVSRVFPGKRMPGRMGGDTVTVKNMGVIDIDQENNILLVKGGVAGANKGFIMIKGEGELRYQAPEENTPKKEEVAEKTEVEETENKEPEAKESVEATDKKEEDAEAQAQEPTKETEATETKEEVKDK